MLIQGLMKAVVEETTKSTIRTKQNREGFSPLQRSLQFELHPDNIQSALLSTSRQVRFYPLGPTI